MQHLRRAAAALLFFAGFAAADAADFRIAVEPAYPHDQAQDVYKPLLDYLAASTGHTFQLVVARNERRLRRGEAPLDVDAEVERELERLV